MVASLGTADAYRFPCGCGDCHRLALDTRVQALGRKALEPNTMMARSEHAQVAVAAASAHKPSRYWELFSVVFLLVLLLGVATPIALLIWQSAATTAAVRSGSAGTFVSATASQGGFFSSPLTNVQTTGGSVVVQGTFSAPRGRALAVEELNKTGLHLCAVGGLASCVPLEGHWAGQLTATPQAAGAFDFVGHGLSSDDLGRWLMAGLIFAFIAFAWLLAIGVGGRIP
ncbi:MAG: hypothetical protein EPN36_16585 [Rhodanobacteraceae bacterium]|nr:MAG: hypothetical protein EPN36_16585 [Rhodanobacteraceae bacterium]